MYDSAVKLQSNEAFSRARRRALWQAVLRFFSGKQSVRAGPLSFDAVRDKLKIRGQHYAGLQIIPLDKIVGSVGRYHDFDRAFLPAQERIAVHRYFVGRRESREVPYAEAVARWHDEVYSPLVEIIREADILEQFPGRTEADLYLWLIEHRHYLSEETGYEVPLEEAAADFSAEFSRGPGRKELEAGVKKAMADNKEPTGR